MVIARWQTVSNLSKVSGVYQKENWGVKKKKKSNKLKEILQLEVIDKYKKYSGTTGVTITQQPNKVSGKRDKTDCQSSTTY